MKTKVTLTVDDDYTEDQITTNRIELEVTNPVITSGWEHLLKTAPKKELYFEVLQRFEQLISEVKG